MIHQEAAQYITSCGLSYMDVKEKNHDMVKASLKEAREVHGNQVMYCPECFDVSEEITSWADE